MITKLGYIGSSAPDGGSVMTTHTLPQTGAMMIALTLATGLVACKSIREKKAEEAGDLVKEWRIEGAIDPDSIPDAPTAGMTGAEFLEMNKLKDGIVVLPSGLQYRILDHGNGIKPELEDSVLVHYKMLNLEGDEVDNSRSYEDGKPQSFRVAKVIGGWREALLRMPEGSRWKLYVPPDLGYGSTGIASVEANETLIYEIELFQVKSSALSSSPDLGGDSQVSIDPRE